MTVTPEIVREIEKALKCSRRERQKLVHILRKYKIPVTQHIEKILATMDTYLSAWYCVVMMEVTETYVVKEEETGCATCKTGKPNKTTKKRQKRCSSVPSNSPPPCSTSPTISSAASPPANSPLGKSSK